MRHTDFAIENDHVRIPHPESYSDCITLIKSDQYRFNGKFLSTFRILVKNLRPLTNNVLFWFRLSAYKGWLYPLCKFMYKRASIRFGVDIPSSTRVGYGLYIGHGMSIVVNGGTIIGNNVNLSQFLNIGSNHNTPAIIGDEVYVAPQVSIVEDVKIGKYAIIGAGAVVTKDIPEAATAAGAPARVLHITPPENRNPNQQNKYVGNLYPLPWKKI